ncbi:MAG: MEDS domain-containing protein [Pseudonocardiales bacterium]|nr:MEDS domain-containing protein [Pseudonocardiales bacterium]
MTPYQRPKRRPRRPDGYVLLDRAWAERLGVPRSGGLYRIGRRELADRLAGLSGAKPFVDQLQARIRDLAANEPPRDDLTTLGGCSHVLGFYETAAFLAGSVRDFLAPGLRAGDAAIVVANASHRTLFGRALEKAGIDVRAAQRSGRYIALDASETLSTFMVTCMPDVARFSATVEKVIYRAAAGTRNVRIYGEMVAVLWDQGNVAAAIELERLWNDLAARHPFSLFCAYPLHAFDTDADTEQFQQVCTQHSAVIPTVG